MTRGRRNHKRPDYRHKLLDIEWQRSAWNRGGSWIKEELGAVPPPPPPHHNTNLVHRMTRERRNHKRPDYRHKLLEIEWQRSAWNRGGSWSKRNWELPLPPPTPQHQPGSSHDEGEEESQEIWLQTQASRNRATKVLPGTEEDREQRGTGSCFPPPPHNTNLVHRMTRGRRNHKRPDYRHKLLEIERQRSAWNRGGSGSKWNWESHPPPPPPMPLLPPPPSTYY